MSWDRRRKTFGTLQIEFEDLLQRCAERPVQVHDKGRRYGLCTMPLTV
jgi:hypothetical protein